MLELEPEVGEEGLDEQAPQGNEEEEADGQQGTPDQDPSTLEFTPPKMKLCLGKVAAGLRIRNGTTFMVGCELRSLFYPSANMAVFLARRDSWV